MHDRLDDLKKKTEDMQKDRKELELIFEKASTGRGGGEKGRGGGGGEGEGKGGGGAAHFANGGISGDSGNINIIRSIFGFLIQMELGNSR